MKNQQKTHFKCLGWTSMNLSWSSMLKSVWGEFCLICLSFRTLTKLEMRVTDKRTILETKLKILSQSEDMEDFYSIYSSVDS